MTNDPPGQLNAVLEPLRAVADEVVVAVDDRIDKDLVPAYGEHADILLRFPYAPPMERSLGWLHAQASGEWVFRVDGDEIVVPETAAALPELCRDDNAFAHWFPRRWLWPDTDHWINELPWAPDFQLRLLRNDPRTLWFPGLLHSSAANVRPAVWHELPMYHLDCVVKDAETRRSKAASYDAQRPGLLAEGGLLSTNEMYDPDRFATTTPVSVPKAHRAAISRAVKATPPERSVWTAEIGRVSRADVDAHYGARHDSRDVPSLRRGRLEVVDTDLRFVAGTPRPLTVRVHNDTDEWFAGGVSDRPRVRVSSRWISRDDLAVTVEGPREVLGAPLAPGKSTLHPLTIEPPTLAGPWTLELDLMHEYVAWFGGGAALPVTILERDGDSDRRVPPTCPDDEADDLPVVAAVLVTGTPERWLATLESLRHTEPTLRLVAAVHTDRARMVLREHVDDLIDTDDLGVLLDHTRGGRRQHVLVVVDPVLVPKAFLLRARVMVRSALRTGSVSFWSNAAGFLSFPHRNTPQGHQLSGGDADSVTLLLRSVAPATDSVPIPFATGAAVVLSHWLLSATEPVVPVSPLRPEVAIADLCLRARSRGFIDVLDASTYLTRMDDIGDHSPRWALHDGREWLDGRHPWMPRVFESEITTGRSPVGIAHAAARAKASGLRILIDGRCLGPLEMGTQVQTLAVIDALANREDVREVCVALPGPVPDYGAKVLTQGKVNANWTTSEDITEPFGPIDIVHRPYQPDGSLNVNAWRANASRVVLTIQDLIAYGIGAYHQTDEVWDRYRTATQDAVRHVDGVVVISHDVRRHFGAEAMPVDEGRLFVAENGTNHLTGHELGQIPRALLALNRVGSRFALCMGTDYAHKNRDLAVAAIRELNAADEGLELVLVGAGVPRGSSRTSEALLSTRSDAKVITLPDVGSDERNWLLRHASVVLYPSGAEGFGLVPFEAARFGTPTVLVRSGAVGEVVGDLPVSSADWEPRSLAEAVRALLLDDELAAAQIKATLAAGTRYTWERTAGTLIGVYRSLLARAPR